MSEDQKKLLEQQLWNIANTLRGKMGANEFDHYWNKEKMKAIQSLSLEEKLDEEKLQNVIGNYLFTDKKPLRDEVIDIMKERPKLKERAKVSERITNKIVHFVETFISGIAS